MRFADRYEAGRQLAQVLTDLKDSGALVLALPRGGVPVAWEIARRTGLPLDIWVSRKIGAPGQPELGVGAVCEDGTVYEDRAFIRRYGLSEAEVEEEAARQTELAKAQAKRLRQGRPPPSLDRRTVLVVDDGIATGGTMRAAIQSLRRQGAARIILAAPVAQLEVADDLGRLADGIECLEPVENLGAVGLWYRNFQQVEDEEVERLLATAHGAERAPAPPFPAEEPGQLPRSLRIQVEGGTLIGDLAIPEDARGLVVFAHGSGSSRLSPRNRRVAQSLNDAGLATLLFDLLTSDEEAFDDRTRVLRFDIPFLSRRLVEVTDLLRSSSRLRGLPIGYFGSSTGAAAALVGASQRPDAIWAVVSRGGRPDLAEAVIPWVRAPTLLIVGGEDHEVLALHREILPEFRTRAELEIVPGATHLFGEPGALEEVSRLAADWFVTYLGQVTAPATL